MAMDWGYIIGSMIGGTITALATNAVAKVGSPQRVAIVGAIVGALGGVGMSMAAKKATEQAMAVR